VKLFGEWYIEVLDNDGRVVWAELSSTECRRNRAVKRTAERFPTPTYLIRRSRLLDSIKTFHGLTSDDLKALADKCGESEEVLRRAAEDEKRRITSTSEMIRFLLGKYAMVIGASASFVVACAFLWLSGHHEAHYFITRLLRNALGIHPSVFLVERYASGAALVSFAATVCFLRVHLGDWFSAFVAAWFFYVLPTFLVYLVVGFVVYRVAGFF